MIRQDYIMRMIQQFVKVLSKILFNKETKNFDEAIHNIDSAFNNILGMNYNLISVLSVDNIKSLVELSQDSAVAKTKYIIIGKLLKERTEIENLNHEDNLKFISSYKKVLRLYLEGILENDVLGIDINPYYSDTKEIIKKLNDDFPEETRFSIFKFYSQIGEYDKAENELFKLKDLNYPNIFNEGIKFYKTLEKLGDPELIKGNLSQKEVAEGLKEFSEGKN